MVLLFIQRTLTYPKDRAFVKIQARHLPGIQNGIQNGIQSEKENGKQNGKQNEKQNRKQNGKETAELRLS